MKIIVIPNPKLKSELDAINKKALSLAGDLIAGEIDKYVPFRTGYLSQSAFKGGKRVKQSKDNDKHIFITYDAPYAAKMYFGEGFNFSKNSHPLAKAYWGRETIGNFSKMQKILKASYKQAERGI